jgi:hypothetical protein
MLQEELALFSLEVATSPNKQYQLFLSLIRHKKRLMKREDSRRKRRKDLLKSQQWQQLHLNKLTKHKEEVDLSPTQTHTHLSKCIILQVELAVLPFNC